MKLETMLEKCRREQWKVGDLDWLGTPRDMSREDEMAIVQYFTDMAAIERLAGALFHEQEKKVDDPTLKAIFRTFVKDEVRHAHAAQMLADYYDVHHYATYEVNPALRAFVPHFINTIHYLAPDIANAYITSGELVLDIALLRSINDYVHDGMSQRAMDLINRDESRHIAIDYHMIEYYTSAAYERQLRAQPRLPLGDRLRSWWSFANMLYYASPFIRAVFFRTMEVVDPSGDRMREAFKRVQLIASKPNVRQRPFIRFMLALQDLYRRPAVGAVFGPVLERVIGLPGAVLQQLHTDEEAARAARMSFDALADEALAAKRAS